MLISLNTWEFYNSIIFFKNYVFRVLIKNAKYLAHQKGKAYYFNNQMWHSTNKAKHKIYEMNRSGYVFPEFQFTLKLVIIIHGMYLVMMESCYKEDLEKGGLKMKMKPKIIDLMYQLFSCT